ncbi:MAG: hypothetical protein JNL01_14910 [Bdellovibrionales bacterium]|nr:hypothetical protein [Bdellovibrionales bacterium]
MRLPLLLGIGLVFGINHALSQESAPLLLGIGEQRFLAIPDLKKYSLGSRKLRATTLNPTETQGRGILVQAIEAGAANLVIQHLDGRTEKRTIWVQKTPWVETKPTLLRALQDLRETEIFWIPQGALIRGELQSWEEAKRIEDLKKAFPKEVLDETTPSPQYVIGARTRLDAYLKDQELDFLQLKSEPDRNRFWGLCPSRALCDRVQKDLRKLDPRIDWQLSSLGSDDPTVLFKVFLLEVARNQTQETGVRWPGSWPLLKGKNAADLEVSLRALEKGGDARILSQPEVAVRIPGEAELFSGGELPIRTSAQFFSNIQWKSFGLSLKLKVLETNGKKVRLEIQTEVSHLAPGIGEDPAPGLDANRLKTQVDAEFHEPLLLSGLLKKTFRKQREGIPFWSQIPLIGPLIFGFGSNTEEEAELVAILVPSPIQPRPNLPQGWTRIQAPLGKAPAARNYLRESEIDALLQSPEYPWNAF